MDDIPATERIGTGERDHFIPVRKIDVLETLAADGALGGEPEREKFRQLCRLLGAIYHYQYFDQLERLRNDYYYFNPETEHHERFATTLLEKAYRDLTEALVAVLHGANFVEVTREEIERSHREDAIVRMRIEAPVDIYREVRFFRRGHHKETVEFSSWFGLRKRKAEIGVYDDVVMLVSMKEAGPADGQQGKRRRARKPRIRPGAVLLKYFRSIASADLNALFPDVKILMSFKDRLWIGVPALLGGIPILLKLASTLTVLFLVAGFYLGFSEAVKDDDMSGAMAAVGGLVALGGFIVTQWMKFQRQSLMYHKVLTDNVYYRNVNNNAGIFDYIIGEAEEQECKEAFLAYHFIRAAAGAATAEALDRMIETWLKETFRLDVDFECDDAVAKLDRLGLLRRDGERLAVLPLDDAVVRLDRYWDDFFRAAPVG